MFEEWQQQLSKKNDTFICHAASNAALYSNNALWTLTSLYITGKNPKEAFKSCEKQSSVQCLKTTASKK